MTYQQHVQAITTAILRGESAYTHEGCAPVSLPSPQRAATMTQQTTYALLKARDIATIFVTK